MSRRHEHIYQLAQEWMRWLNSRYFLGRAEAKNILLRLQPHKLSSKEPDGIMSAEISAFNTAVNHIEKSNRLIPFIAVYCKVKPKSVAELAAELRISRTQFYEIAHSTALEIFNHAMKLVKTQK